ncbi:MAG: response regulator [Cyclobacteriaceae bacterium]|jgi:CheY-like chemotaxis protein|nr:response regulator [Cyclobacteriaceae bacterium]
MSAKKYRAVMLVDDNEIDNLINQKMIEAAAIAENIYTHTGAKSAIEFLRNIERIDVVDQVLPDVIFLDIDMPLMDGFQFLEEFNKLSNTVKKKCRIVMLTSSINPQDFSRSKKYENVKVYLNKPLSHENIVNLQV